MTPWLVPSSSAGILALGRVGGHLLEITFPGEPTRRQLQSDSSLKNRLRFGCALAAVKFVFLNGREDELGLEKQ